MTAETSNLFRVGDRVRTTRLPPDLSDRDHTVGTAGVVTHVYPEDNPPTYQVAFDNGEDWFCYQYGLESAPPLPTPEEALAGLTAILDSETFGEYAERVDLDLRYR